MRASAEISLYPLKEDYKQRIIDFIFRLRSHDKIEVITNGMSTQIFGEFNEIMEVLQKELGNELETHRSMFVLKIGAGEMRPENIAAELR
ncbi:MAG: YkoF family thiamine/hydroxymethylpyrimidine-binding protein [Vicingaceae bacterium]